MNLFGKKDKDIKNDFYEKYSKGQREECEGVWFEMSGKFKVKISAFSERNLSYQSARSKYYDPIFKRHEEGIKVSFEEIYQAKVNLIADSILKDWEGLFVDKRSFYDPCFESFKDGDIIEFSRENAVKVLSKFPSLLEDIEKKAGQMNLFFTQEDQVARDT